jgi:hypothetical protein
MDLFLDVENAFKLEKNAQNADSNANVDGPSKR